MDVLILSKKEVKGPLKGIVETPISDVLTTHIRYNEFLRPEIFQEELANMIHAKNTSIGPQDKCVLLFLK